MENPDSKLYMMPKQTYEAYNKIIADEFKQNKNAFLKVYDYITSLFKTNATVLNLPFHITNKVGNNYRMYIEYGSRYLTLNTQKEQYKPLEEQVNSMAEQGQSGLK